MDELMIFENEEFGQLSTIIINGETWFIGKEVVSALGYTDLTHAVLDHVYEEDRVNTKTVGLNAPEFGQRGTWLINESGLYSLVFGSKVPKARDFKRWVTSEILPTLRKTGNYSIKQKADSYTIENPAERARRWAEEYEERLALEEKVKELEPKAYIHDKMLDSKLLVNFRDAAKEIGVSQSQFTGWLKENGYVYSNSAGELRPMEQYMASGLFEMKPYQNPYNGYCGSRTSLPREVWLHLRYFLIQVVITEIP